MATEKVSLSLEQGALVLARRAAELEGVTLSQYMSQLVRRYAWASQRPVLSREDQAVEDARTVELDAQEEDGWAGGASRAAG